MPQPHAAPTIARLPAACACLPQKMTTTQAVDNNYISWEEQLSL